MNILGNSTKTNCMLRHTDKSMTCSLSTDLTANHQ